MNRKKIINLTRNGVISLIFLGLFINIGLSLVLLWFSTNLIQKVLFFNQFISNLIIINFGTVWLLKNLPLLIDGIEGTVREYTSKKRTKSFMVKESHSFIGLYLLVFFMINSIASSIILKIITKNILLATLYSNIMISLLLINFGVILYLRWKKIIHLVVDIVEKDDFRGNQIY